MCCITFAGQEATMATTQLMRATSYEICWTRPEDARTEFRPPRMNWVVVTDENQNCRMQMHWEPSAGNR
jgi:hypothetical protein